MQTRMASVTIATWKTVKKKSAASRTQTKTVSATTVIWKTAGNSRQVNRTLPDSLAWNRLPPKAIHAPAVTDRGMAQDGDAGVVNRCAMQ